MQKIETVSCGSIEIGNGAPLVVVAGPCVIENERMVFESVEFLAQLCEKYKFPFIFKASYDKANRSSASSFRGPGLEKGLAILSKVKREYKIPVIADVHRPEDCDALAEVVDIIQIPAFLCRQTDLLLAAASTQIAVNIKRGQFVAPYDMGNAVMKVRETGNQRVLLTERGFTFGYNNLVSDMRAIPDMRAFAPVVYDVTHSVQRPGGLGATTGGDRRYVPTLVRAAIAAGADALFMETHASPEKGLSDADTMYPFSRLESLFVQIKRLSEAVRQMDGVWGEQDA